VRQIEGFDFFQLEYDLSGNLKTPQELGALATRAASASDVIFMAHGWRNSEFDADELYSGFLNTFRANMRLPAVAAPLAGRDIVVAGVLWPSKALPEKEQDLPSGGTVLAAPDDDNNALLQARQGLEGLRAEVAGSSREAALNAALGLLDRIADDEDAQDAFVSHVLSLLSQADADPTEGLPDFIAMPGREVLSRLSTPDIGPVSAPDDGGDVGGSLPLDTGTLPDFGGGQAAGFGDFVKKIAFGAAKLVNFTTWYLMLEASAVVGQRGLSRDVRAVRAAARDVRVHLVGHSLGGRLVTACAKALSDDPPAPIDTLYLLQAAFSHFGFSPSNPFGVPGFFRKVVAQGIVRGALLVTHSIRDAVVGYAYALAAAVTLNTTRALVGGPHDPFGGIGHNGALDTPESKPSPLGQTAYSFEKGKVNNLNGDAVIASHGDVKKAEVTYPFAWALAHP
jgi:pimeloyl-ACP methyl ester carboxylesterase